MRIHKILGNSLSRGTALLFALSIVLLTFATSAFAQPAPSPATPATTPTPSSQSLDWRRGMAKTLPQKRGCFTSSYPSTEWQGVPCTTASAPPMIVASGDIQATVTGYISTAVGSFDSVTGVTEETGQIDGTGGQVPNSYTLQLNTSYFSTPSCSGAANPAICAGFQQFLFSTPGFLGNCGSGNACVLMQYWLIDWGSTNCPSGWTYYNNQGHENCAMNSNLMAVPEQTISNLVNLSVMGQANNGGMDAVIFSTGSVLYAVQNDASILYLAQNWQAVAFNDLGNCCGTAANFNSGSTIVVRTSMDSGTTSAPTCIGHSGTSLGESNNLSFGAAHAARAGTAPALVFTESSAGTAASPCDSAIELPSGGLTDTHDFNRDGYSDIVWRNTSNSVALWLMSSNSVVGSAGLGTVPSNLSIVGQHDFNGDGFADILWRDTNGTISMWLMNGTSVTQATVISNVPTSFTLAGAADLNGDGKGDLLWYDTSSGTLSVWFMNGAGVSGTSVLGSVPVNTWTILGDTDGSVFWRDASGDIALWGLQNGQVVTSNDLGTVTSNFVVQGLGDFNGDRFPDILWRDTNSGIISIWFTNGQTVTSAGVVSTLPSTWNVVQVGDYNGDGSSDLLLMDTSGDVAIWLMNGTTVSQSLGVSNVGTGWTVQNVNTN
jgi:FG-GAP-like repeat